MSSQLIAPYLQDGYWSGQMLLNGHAEVPSLQGHDTRSLKDALDTVSEYTKQQGSKLSVSTFRDGDEWVSDSHNPGTIVVLHEESLWRSGALTADQLAKAAGDGPVAVREIYGRPGVEIAARVGEAQLTYRRQAALGVVALNKKGVHVFLSIPEEAVETTNGGKLHVTKIAPQPANLTVGATYHYLPKDEGEGERLRRVNLIEVVSTGTPKTAKAQGGLAFLTRLVTNPSGA